MCAAPLRGEGKALSHRTEGQEKGHLVNFPGLTSLTVLTMSRDTPESARLPRSSNGDGGRPRPSMQRDSAQIIAAKIRQAFDLRGRRVLEVGCGDGRVTALIAQEPAQLVAIDPDAARISRARQDRPGVDFRIGTGEDLKFPAGFFDLVLFTLSLHHQDCSLAVKEATRVLREDGRILVVEPVSDGELERVLNVLDDETAVTGRVQETLKGCSLRLECCEIFHACWSFDDQSDLFQSLFDYYGKPFDQMLATQMSDIVAGKLDDRPIVLEDKLILQVFRKCSQAGS